MTQPDMSCAEWHKSTYSSQSGNCVEVALNLPGIVAIRDSRDPEGSPLMLTHEAWQVFVRGLTHD